MEFKLPITEVMLLEMSLEDAKKLLGVTDSIALDKAYKTAARKYHPDLGGSDEMMQKVNQAYELLKASGGGKSYSSMSDDERRAAFKASREASKKRAEVNKGKMERIMADYAQRFKGSLDLYNAHFGEFFTLKEPEIKTAVQKGWSEGWSGKIQAVWPTGDGNTEIRLFVTITTDQSKGLGYGEDPDYTVTYETSLYHNRKAHKMGRRDWKWGQLSSTVLDPEKIFPKAKLKKVIKKEFKDKMTKKDFSKALNSEFKKYNPSFKFRSGIGFNFDREDKIWVFIDRMVMDRKPYWSITFRKDTSPEGKQPYLQYVTSKSADMPDHVKDAATSFAFPETSTAVDLLKDFLNKFIANKKISKDHFKPAWEKDGKKKNRFENMGIADEILKNLVSVNENVDGEEQLDENVFQYYYAQDKARDPNKSNRNSKIHNLLKSDKKVDDEQD